MLLTQVCASLTAQDTICYPDMDEFSCALFVRWLYGAALPGPSGFHSMQHYLALYVLALNFRIEKLQNQIMDRIRAYYRSANMTAPPFRLEYLYSATDGPNKMKAFLVATAAYRVGCEGHLSEVMKDVVGKGGELAVNFVDALLKLLKEDGEGDVRVGSDCLWHEHSNTMVCDST
jgi:hypothetical protein